MQSILLLLSTFWASNRDWLIPVVIVPGLGWTFTRMTVFTSSDAWDAFKKTHPYWAGLIVWARTYLPDASRKVLAKQGVVLTDTSPSPVDPRIGVRIGPGVIVVKDPEVKP